MPKTTEFHCKNCGRCCGPIPVTEQEWRKIRRAIKNKPWSEIDRMVNQERELLTCPLRDIEQKACFIYEARPIICKLQGTQVGLPCPLKPSAATRTDGLEILKAEHGESPEICGIMGITLRWTELLNGINNKRRLPQCVLNTAPTQVASSTPTTPR
jgi:hypothetical protein